MHTSAVFAGATSQPPFAVAAANERPAGTLERQAKRLTIGARLSRLAFCRFACWRFSRHVVRLWQKVGDDCFVHKEIRSSDKGNTYEGTRLGVSPGEHTPGVAPSAISRPRQRGGALVEAGAARPLCSRLVACARGRRVLLWPTADEVERSDNPFFFLACWSYIKERRNLLFGANNRLRCWTRGVEFGRIRGCRQLDSTLSH